MKKALITGVAGQDGSYLAELLLADGYDVFGLSKPGSDRRFVPAAVTVIEGDLSDPDSIVHAVQTSLPHEVYNLGGVTTLKEAYENPEKTWTVNFESVGILLEESLKANPSVRFLQASSSEIFLPSEVSLNEESPRDWETKNPYAKAKLAADRDVIHAARSRGAFACSAFLFNHESPRRRPEAVLRKITRILAKIRLGQESVLPVGNIEQARDWVFAGDVVEAMRRMLRQDAPDDFVIASGELHSVKEAIDIAAETLYIQNVWGVVKTDLALFRPTEVHPKVGDIRKADRVLGWMPATDFRSLVELMTKTEIDGLQRGLS